ncbi:hypothetical protein F5Y04DRAFT_166395 [Hypomontagnella monticulosa]|nr:hypothetical protein F5Y04DRAFT_166395 [Hypomontagnella monticulosa]
MADDNPSEGIPLVALSPSGAGSEGNGQNRGTANAYCGDDDDGAAPAPIFLSDKILLSTPPVFVPVRRGRWSSSFLNLMRGPYVRQAVVFLAIIAHRSLVTRLRQDEPANQVVLGPIVIVTIMISVFLPLQFHQITHAFQQPRLDTRLFIGIRAFATLIVACIIAPLLILPIFDSTSFDFNKDGIETARNTTYATLSSWSAVAPNLRGSFPSVMEIQNPGGKIRLPLNPWAVTTETIQKLMKDAITFPLPRNGKGSGERRWNEKPGDAHGVYMPVLTWPVRNLPQDGTMDLESNFRTPTQVLAVRLVCHFANVSGVVMRRSNASEPILSVRLYDSNSCAAQIDMPARHLEPDLRDDVVRKLGNAEFQKDKFAELQQHYLRLARGDAPVAVYTPAWARLSADEDNVEAPRNKTLCQSRLGMVGLSLAFQADDTVPPASLFEAASCEPEFAVADIELTFNGQSPLKSGAESLGTYLGAHTYWNARKLDSDWAPLDARADVQLREGLLADAAEFSALGGHWAWPVINEGLGDLGHGRPQRVGSLLLAGRLIRESFVAKLAVAADLTLRERLADGDVRVRLGLEKVAARAARTVFQDRWLFQIPLWLAFAAFFFIEFTTHEVAEASTHVPAWVPWPLTSPAARAMLLRHSSVLPWLRALRTGQAQPEDLPHMYIGNWLIHEKAGKSGWRLDLPQFYHPPAGGRRKKRTVDPQMSEDMLASIILLYHGIAASVVIVLYAVLLSVAVGQYAGGSQPLDSMAERWRVRGVVGLEPNVSFWSVLFWRILPTSLIFYCAIFWIPSVYHFLCGRQPWSGLLRNVRSASESITLDYSNRYFPLLYAIRNRHWLVAAFSVGTLAAVFVPIVQPRVLQVSRVQVRQAESVVVSGSRWEWADSPSESPFSPGRLPFDRAIQDLAKRGQDNDDLIQPFSPAPAILPLDLAGAELGDYPYAIYEAPALFASLDCENVAIEPVASPDTGSKSGRDPVTEVLVRLGTEGPSAVVKIPIPCSMPTASRLAVPVQPNAQQALCMQWWLHDNSSQNAPDNENPRWIVVALSGQRVLLPSTRDLQFSHPPSTMAIACRSALRKESTRITVSTDPKTQNSTTPIHHETLGGGSALDRRIVAVLDRGLNASNTRLDGFDGGMVVLDAVVRADRFSGDFLSWVLYQQMFAACPACLDAASLRRGASLAYTAAIGALAAQDDTHSLLMSPAVNPNPLTLRPFRLEGKTPVGWGAFAFQVTILLVCIGFISAVFRTYRSYKLPLSPEPLVHSLVLLNNHGLIKWLETEFAFPERIKLRDIHKTIERSGWQFMLEPHEEEGRLVLSLGMIRNGDQEDAGTQEPYHDDVDEEVGSGLQRRRSWTVAENTS